MVWCSVVDGGTFWTKHCVVCGIIPTRADRCWYLAAFDTTAWGEFGKTGNKTPWHNNAIQKDVDSDLREQTEMDVAFGKTLDPIEGSQSFCGWYFWNRWKRNGTTRLDQTSNKNISMLVQKTRVMDLHKTNSLNTNSPKLDRTLRKIKEKPLKTWMRCQWNEIRRKTSNALLQCTQYTEVFWDSYIGCRTMLDSNVLSISPNVLRWQLLLVFAI